ncbi:SulP family inorganic anion transporter [Neptuniibacter caesariensis]|uniref:Sulfate permease n=1 Tax=Neptuniibacter caesariensis TaxID=207954 RepID=A0A7U8C7Y6_NEPCE|nr:sulfate permease [Neptuniibacter caesariensis]EAR62969.1 sulfate permease [Oceanospirillum sp. MED92] [Neptuniibacter caesariensis]
MRPLAEYFPLLGWLKDYQRETFISDLMAGVIVAILLIPQAMAYALLAGLPAEYGLYASIVPLYLYSLLGSSRSLAVGPVAIASLMVSTAISQVAEQGSADYLNAAINLSFLVGIILLVLRSLRLGSVVNFISHSVLSGFTSAAAIVIAVSQLKHIAGLDTPRASTLDQNIENLLQHSQDTNLTTVLLAGFAFFTLWYCKNSLCCHLQRMAMPDWLVQPICKAGPMFAVLFGTLIVWQLDLKTQAGVTTVGMIPQGLPGLKGIHLDLELWKQLFTPALLIALIGFLESVSVGTALASKRQERIDPNKELIALGAANIGSALSGTYPVAGGFGRSMVNHSAGAQSTVASLVSATLVAITVAFFTPLFYYLPNTVLAAIIIMAVIPLVDLQAFKTSWTFNKADALTLSTTFLMVLFLGVELGILMGIAISIALLLYRSSQPHIAVVGRVGASEHFRNVTRHDVVTDTSTLALRVDESLYFANTRFVEEFILKHCADNPEIKHVVLICTAVNFIDASALETLEQLVKNLRDDEVVLHLSEVKGPVMDQLNSTRFVEQMGQGKIYFTTDQAMRELAGI